MSNSDMWYVVKQANGQCAILSAHELESLAEATRPEKWGPYATQQDAIARRVGLIRAGKCQPV